ncbi:DUF2478 domain-containing protein [Pararhodobacter sp.]|uniref:DUF2478 domain-containing protein n=1 Tax=Pararhodobacter sp. TaxID=2127056 RepID=UPI002AFF7AB9|nr:DUF2478 domain-containing protein [Pararhodobacter sp.]
MIPQEQALFPLATVTGTERGQTDRLLAEVARVLSAEGWALAGVVQVNSGRPGRAHCDMDLQVLGRAEVIRISQNLGEESRGCRLDPEGLETAVALVEGTLADRPRLLILNKFGKAEIEGRGFRPLIAAALEQGVPVLMGLKPLNRPGFEDFAEGLGQGLPADLDQILDWCRKTAAIEPLTFQ